MGTYPCACLCVWNGMHEMCMLWHVMWMCVYRMGCWENLCGECMRYNMREWGCWDMCEGGWHTVYMGEMCMDMWGGCVYQSVRILWSPATRAPHPPCRTPTIHFLTLSFFHFPESHIWNPGMLLCYLLSKWIREKKNKEVPWRGSSGFWNVWK